MKMDQLSATQQSKLNATKVQLRLENEQYLRAHPELRSLISHFMAQLLEGKPDNVQHFAAEYFMQADLEQQVRARNRR